MKLGDVSLDSKWIYLNASNIRSYNGTEIHYAIKHFDIINCAYSFWWNKSL